MIKLPIPLEGSNHFNLSLYHTYYGSSSNISLITFMGVNTSPYYFFSIVFGIKVSLINNNNYYG